MKSGKPHLGAEILPEATTTMEAQGLCYVSVCVTGSSGKSIYSQLVRAHDTGWQGITFFAHGDTPQAAAAAHGYYVGS